MKKNFRILIIDDAFFMRILLKKTLAKKPSSKYMFEVVAEATNGKEGIDLYNLCKADIVTVDINMDKLNGIEFLNRVRKINPNINAIIISTTMNSDVKMQLSKDNTYYLPKSFQPEILYKILDEIAVNVNDKLSKNGLNKNNVIEDNKSLNAEVKPSIKEKEKADNLNKNSKKTQNNSVNNELKEKNNSLEVKEKSKKKSSVNIIEETEFSIPLSFITNETLDKKNNNIHSDKNKSSKKKSRNNNITIKSEKPIVNENIMVDKDYETVKSDDLFLKENKEPTEVFIKDNQIKENIANTSSNNDVLNEIINIDCGDELLGSEINNTEIKDDLLISYSSDENLNEKLQLNNAINENVEKDSIDEVVITKLDEDKKVSPTDEVNTNQLNDQFSIPSLSELENSLNSINSLDETLGLNENKIENDIVESETKSIVNNEDKDNSLYYEVVKVDYNSLENLTKDDDDEDILIVINDDEEETDKYESDNSNYLEETNDCYKDDNFSLSEENIDEKELLLTTKYSYDIEVNNVIKDMKTQIENQDLLQVKKEIKTKSEEKIVKSPQKDELSELDKALKELKTKNFEEDLIILVDDKDENVSKDEFNELDLSGLEKELNSLNINIPKVNIDSANIDKDSTSNLELNNRQSDYNASIKERTSINIAPTKKELLDVYNPTIKTKEKIINSKNDENKNTKKGAKKRFGFLSKLFRKKNKK